MKWKSSKFGWNYIKDEQIYGRLISDNVTGKYIAKWKNSKGEITGRENLYFGSAKRLVETNAKLPL